MDVAILVSPAGCYNENTSGALATETDLTDKGCAMPNDRTFRVIPIASVLALALMGSTALAGTVLTLPATGAGAVNGSDHEHRELSGHR